MFSETKHVSRVILIILQFMLNVSMLSAVAVVCCEFVVYLITYYSLQLKVIDSYLCQIMPIPVQIQRFQRICWKLDSRMRRTYLWLIWHHRVSHWKVHHLEVEQDGYLSQFLNLLLGDILVAIIDGETNVHAATPNTSKQVLHNCGVQQQMMKCVYFFWLLHFYRSLWSCQISKYAGHDISVLFFMQPVSYHTFAKLRQNLHCFNETYKSEDGLCWELYEVWPIFDNLDEKFLVCCTESPRKKSAVNWSLSAMAQNSETLNETSIWKCFGNELEPFRGVHATVA